MLDQLDKKESKISTTDSCNNLKIKFEKCLSENEDKIDFCRDIRRKFEKCINKKNKINELYIIKQ